MKSLTRILLLAAILLPLCMTAGKPKDQQGQPEWQLLSVDNHDFGNIREDGGPVKVSFQFTNAGTAPLSIISALAQCGCTRPKAPENPVKPGQKSQITVTYLPQGRPGSFRKKITVRTNDPRHKKVYLTITGNVVPADK